MYITLHVYFEHLSGKLMKKGNFSVNMINFRKDEMKEVARIASKFVQQIEMEIGLIKLEKVIYNGDKNIVDLIKNEGRNAPFIFHKFVKKIYKNVLQTRQYML